MRSRSVGTWLGVLLVTGFVITAAYRAGRDSMSAEGGPPAMASEPMIVVAAVPLRAGQMDQVWTLFGTVASLSGTVHSYSHPFESRIVRLHVSDGQHVDADAALFDSARSPVSKIAAEAAINLLEEARQNLQQVLGRQSDGLATREEAIKAQGRFQRAKQQVDAMRQSGQLEETLTMRSSLAGVVANPGNQVGSLMPAGTPIVSITEDASIGVLLWAEPTTAAAIRIGAKVSIQTLANDSTTALDGRVVRVDERVDPISRLVRVSVKLENPGALILGQSVRGEIASHPAQGFLVPRVSLTARDGRFWIFTIGRSRTRSAGRCDRRRSR